MALTKFVHLGALLELTISSTDSNFFPVVFCPRTTAIDHNVGPESK